MKTAFKLQNYFYLHNYESMLNDLKVLIENLLKTPCKLLYFIIKQWLWLTNKDDMHNA